LLKKIYSSFPDEHLLGLVSHGQPAGFEVLYERYAQRLLSYFYRMLGNNENKAQDFLQELFMKVIAKAVTFKKGGNFSSWVFTLACNMCKNEYRGQAVQKQAHQTLRQETDQLQPGSADLALHHQGFMNDLDQELALLDERKRSIFILRFQEGFSINDIGRIIDCPPGTVKSNLFNTIKKKPNDLPTT
jgi:RNA polymerase sigma-70 factor (ECF subfamily)